MSVKISHFCTLQLEPQTDMLIAYCLNLYHKDI